MLALTGAAAGCGGAPYIRAEGEFNRSRADFGRAPQDIENLTICYSGWETTEAAVAAMARARCAEFGKTAVFEEDTMTLCPVLTPVAAKFQCVKQGAQAAKTPGAAGLAPGL